MYELKIDSMGYKVLVKNGLLFIPIDPQNRHYQEYKKAVESGEQVDLGV